MVRTPPDLISRVWYVHLTRVSCDTGHTMFRAGWSLKRTCLQQCSKGAHTAIHYVCELLTGLSGFSYTHMPQAVLQGCAYSNISHAWVVSCVDEATDPKDRPKQSTPVLSRKLLFTASHLSSAELQSLRLATDYATHCDSLLLTMPLTVLSIHTMQLTVTPYDRLCHSLQLPITDTHYATHCDYL